MSKTSNIYAYFFEKALKEANIVSFIIPKSILNAPEYVELREELKNYEIKSIIDFGENGFKGVKIETVNIIVDTQGKPSNLIVKSITKILILFKNKSILQVMHFQHG
ncbi:Eco57I restriction-modification methylase domain-containing protein [Spiroplasma clarkii]|uniref:Eco57I restriction-modification methylase domain-containing protein n=1 Tax=Spiroplasma clarkii TaxID=2139 RepID=UPI0011BA4C67